MARKTTEKTSLAERGETAIVEKTKKETAVVSKPKAETAMVKKEKAERAVVKKEKAETAVVKKEKAETAVVKKEKAERAVVKKEKKTAAAKTPKTGGKGRKKAGLDRDGMVYMDIVNYVREKLKTADAGVIGGKAAFQVDVTGQGSGIFYIEIVDGFLAVEPYDYHDRNARLVVSSDDLLDIVEKKLNFDKALTEGRLYVDGDWDRAMELKKLLAQL